MVDAATIEAFQSEGVVAVRAALSDDWLRLLDATMPEILDGAQESIAARDPATPASYSRVGIWRSCERFARFLFGSSIGGIAASVMRSQVARLYEDLLIYKVAGGDGTTPWHRDAPHWPIAGRQLCSVWMSLEPVGRGAGAMRFVAGSHADDGEVVDGHSIYVDQAEVERRPVRTFETEPGDVVVFHPQVLHTVESIVTEQPRRTFTIRFAGDDVRWRPRRQTYHPWMADCGLGLGDELDHPWFPLVSGPLTASG